MKSVGLALDCNRLRWGVTNVLVALFWFRFHKAIVHWILFGFIGEGYAKLV
jgi:hypothetical protein